MSLKGRIGVERLGFGCTAMPGRLTTHEAFALLDAACEAGLRHFDTARMYCSGESEAALGAFMKTRGLSLRIFTKAGIVPPSRLARGVAKLVPGLHAAPTSGKFAPHEIRASVETSLRKLRLEQLEALLLHEIRNSEVTPELKETLGALQREGKIRAYGVATSVAETETLVAAHPELCCIIQAPASWLDRRRPRPPGSLLILHSVLNARLPALLDRLRAEPHIARWFKEETGLTHANAEDIGCLLLASAVSGNPEGVTLFATSRPERVARNVTRLSAGVEARAIAAVDRLLNAREGAARAKS